MHATTLYSGAHPDFQIDDPELTQAKEIRRRPNHEISS